MVQTIRNTEYQIFLELLDSIVPSTLDIYYLEDIFKNILRTVMKEKIMIAFLSDIFYWLTIDHPIYDVLNEHLSEFNESFHSLVRRNTMVRITYTHQKFSCDF